MERKVIKLLLKCTGLKDGKPGLTNLVATKDLTVNLNSLTTPAECKRCGDSTKDTVVLATCRFQKLTSQASGWCQQVIPYEALVEMEC